MPGWLNIAGLFGNLGNAFDLGGRFTSRKPVKERDATVLLEEVNKILLMTTDTLELYKGLLPPADYAGFKAEHRVLHLKLQEESAHQRNFNDALIHHGRTPSSTTESKDTVRVRAAYLLGETEAYQNKVIRASRRAHVFEPAAFPDELPQPTRRSPPTISQSTPLPASTPQTESSSTLPPPPAHAPLTDPAPIAKLIRSSVLRSNVGSAPSIRTTATSSTSSFETLNTNTSRALFEGASPPPFLNSATKIFPDDDLLIALTHIREEVTGGSARPTDSTTGLYRRVLSVKAGDEIVDVVDPQLYELADEQVVVDEQVMQVLHQATEKWMAKKLAEDID